MRVVGWAERPLSTKRRRTGWCLAFNLDDQRAGGRCDLYPALDTAAYHCSLLPARYRTYHSGSLVPLRMMEVRLKQSFAAEWAAAEPALRVFCRRLAGSADRGDDVLQEMALRALRGYETFQGRSDFRSWAIRIAKNVFSTMMRGGGKTVPLDENAEMAEAPQAVPAADPPLTFDTVTSVVGEAHVAGALTLAECRVLQVRMAQPGASMEEIGAALGTNGNSLRVRSFHAQRGLWLFILIERPELLGGARSVAYALEQARQVGPPRGLDPADAGVLERAIAVAPLKREQWRDLGRFREAALKLKRYLDLDLLLPGAS